MINLSRPGDGDSVEGRAVDPDGTPENVSGRVRYEVLLLLAVVLGLGIQNQGIIKKLAGYFSKDGDDVTLTYCPTVGDCKEVVLEGSLGEIQRRAREICVRPEDCATTSISGLSGARNNAVTRAICRQVEKASGGEKACSSTMGVQSFGRNWREPTPR